MKKTTMIVVIMSLILSTLSINISGEELNNEVVGNLILNNPSNDIYAPGELIVKFKHEANIDISETKSLETLGIGGESLEATNQGTISMGYDSIDSLNIEYGVYSARKLRTDDTEPISSNIYLLKLPTDSDILSIAEEYTKNENVDYAEPNYIFSLFLTKEKASPIIPIIFPDDPAFYFQWGLYNTGEGGGKKDADIDAPEAWVYETGDPDITIAIIDTGIDYTHVDLADNVWINPGEDLNGNGIVDPSDFNGIDDDVPANGYIDDIRGWNFHTDSNDPIDIYGHGTHCSGIAAAVANNGNGTAGVTWNCKIMPLELNVSDTIFSTTTIEAIYYAVNNGANAISMSWGGTYNMQSLYNALVYAYGKGVVLVASAGNFNNDIKIYPACYPIVIAVAATDRNDNRAFFSNYGDWVDVAAPGAEIYSTLPTYDCAMSEAGYNLGWDALDGTSMSAPHVAGLAALLLSKNRYDDMDDNHFKADMVRTMVLNTADPIDSDEDIGRGRINAYNALTKKPAVAVMDLLTDWINIQDVLHINGWAWGEDFQEYTVYYGEGNDPDSWTEIKSSTTPVKDYTTLAIFDTTVLKNGINTIKLEVICNGVTYTDTKQIITANTPTGDVSLDGYVTIQNLANVQTLPGIKEIPQIAQQNYVQGTKPILN